MGVINGDDQLQIILGPGKAQTASEMMNEMLKAEDGGKSKIFHAGVEVAVAYSKAQQAGKIPLALTLKHKLFDALLYKKLRAAMGGKIRHTNAIEEVSQPDA